MKGFETAARLLPPAARREALGLTGEEKLRCEEFRLRAGQSPTVLLGGREYALAPERIGPEELRAALELASCASFHALADQLRRGFLSAGNGVRIGVCGAAVTAGEEVLGLAGISSLAIRIPRAIPGCADGIFSALGSGSFSSTLILSPPGGGKTTLLRELIRRLSEEGWRVSVADERREIADCASGVPGFDVGCHTDVLTDVPKGKAARMLLRTMNPQILAMDEVTDPSDAQALLEAAGCGVALLATVHGGSLGDVARRPAGRMLLESGVFSRCITVENRGGERRYQVEAVPCG